MCFVDHQSIETACSIWPGWDRGVGGGNTAMVVFWGQAWLATHVVVFHVRFFRSCLEASSGLESLFRRFLRGCGYIGGSLVRSWQPFA